ncbi:Tfp pilus assembly protein PilX [Halomonas shengliensis]|uniref:Tfp pilus assembly protein PilX n=1 Tax=Halomonas shengliensis TaxID=419597 RepID=A0A1H0MRF6_9GAMM|nr:pilus assembly PilX N-terminal domain-containing protein [Halomonas shengliensis]SDO82914.1 Tfp pilus assembly protein PilX [Halomonas shengliensis]
MRHGTVKKRETGAALIVSLVLIVMALVLSVSSMQSSRLEETMAGNQRAAERAARAAEYGAARVVDIIQSKTFADPSSTTLEDEIFCGTAVSSPCVNAGLNQVEEGVYYKVSVKGNQVYSTFLESEGIVLPAGEDISGLNEAEIEALVVAKRYVDFSLKLEGLGELAAFNPVCTASYRATSQASGIDGEEVIEVDGDHQQTYQPAISTISLEEANEVVEGVLVSAGNGSISLDASGTYVDHDDVIFVDDALGGRYHARESVVSIEGADISDNFYVDGDDVEIDYGRCLKANGKPINNPMCSYRGGVSAYAGAKIFERPDAFHKFIASVMRDPSVNFTTFADQNLVFDQVHDFEFDDDDGVGDVEIGINVITNDLHRMLAVVAEEGSSGNDVIVPAAFDSNPSSQVPYDYDSDADGVDDSVVNKTVLLGGILFDGGAGDDDVNEVTFNSAVGFVFDEGAIVATGNTDYVFAKYPYPPSSTASTFLSDFNVTGAADTTPVKLYSEYFPTSQTLFFADGSSPDGVFISECATASCQAAHFYLDDTVTNIAFQDSEIDLDGDGNTDDNGNGSSSDIIGVKRNCLGCSASLPPHALTSDGDDGAYSGKGGILIVDGHARFPGNPSFKGIIITLGDYSIGGGGGDNFYGASIAFPYFYNHEQDAFQCQIINAENNGSGNHDTIHASEAINVALSLLSEEAMENWIVGNNSELYSYVLDGWRERLVQ